MPNYFAPLNYLGDAIDSVGRSASKVGLGTKDGGVSEYLSKLGKTPQASSSFAYPQYGPNPASSTKSELQNAPQYDPNVDIQNYLDGLSGGGSSAPTRSLTYLPNGQAYDLSNPQQAQAYYQAANADSFAVANQNYETTTRNIGRSKDNLRYNTDQSVAELLKQKQQLQAEKENYFANLESQGRDFVTGKAVGDTTRQNYFSNLGSNAFQSSQATSQDYADGKFAEGLASQQKAKVDAEGTYSDRANAFDTQQSNLLRQSSQDAEDLAYAQSDAAFQRDNYIGSNKAQLAGQLGQAASDAGFKDYATKYKVDPYSAVNLAAPDLSDAQTYTNFRPGTSATADTSTSGSKFSGLTGSQAEPLDNYFGYAPDEKTKSRIKNYFSGTAA